MSRPWEPPRMYSWTLLTPDGANSGAVGVSHDEERAFGAAAAALRDAPFGSRCLIHRVTPSFARIAYLYERLVARGVLDPLGHAVVWERIPVSVWDKLRPLTTDPPDVIGDMYPPEAITAAREDADVDRERLQQLDVTPHPHQLGRM